MLNSEPLVPFGIAIIALTGALIVIPYLRGRSDAITAWNLFLMGGAMFIGIGSLEVAYGIFHWPELQWFQPTKSDINKFLLGNVVFYATILTTYYWLKWPRRLVGRYFNKWPPQSANLLFVLLGLCLTIMLLAMVLKGVPIVNALFANVSHKAAVFASVFSFYYWYRNRSNVAALVLFLGVFAYALLFAMVTFLGRRLLLSVTVVPLICMYWLHWRYQSPKFNLVRLGLATLLAFSVAAFYSTIRHASLASGAPDRSFSTVLENIKGASLENAVAQVTRDWMHYFAQYTSHFSLLTIHLIDLGEAKVEPLNTLAFLASYPIPRLIFPAKPSPFGARIVTDVLHLPYQTNWGLGITGHGYHEGGIPVIMLYGVLIVLLIRLLDDALQRQPANVYLLGVICTSAPHFASWIRGDPTTMTAEIIESLFFAWGLSLIGRFLFGTAKIVNEAADPRQARSQFVPQARPFER